MSVTTRAGAHEVTTEGPYHDARVTGLDPDTEYDLVVEGATPDAWLPARVRTLARPPGRLLATIATANDVHFGETECGKTGDPAADAIGPVLRSGSGEIPYPELMNGAIVDEMLALDPDVVVVKGDLTDSGRVEEYEAFLACYGQLGERLHHVRGNHDAMRDPQLARRDAPYAVALDGVVLAVLDTTVPGRVGGALPLRSAPGSMISPAPPPIPCWCSRTIPRSTTIPTTGFPLPTTTRCSICSPGARTSPATSPATRTRTVCSATRGDVTCRASRWRAPRTFRGPGPSTACTRAVTRK